MTNDKYKLFIWCGAAIAASGFGLFFTGMTGAGLTAIAVGALTALSGAAGSLWNE